MKKLIALFLACVMTLSVTVTAFAANDEGITYTAELDKATIQSSGEAQTVVMTVKASQTITVDGVGGTVIIPDGWTIIAIENATLEFATSDYNLENGRIAYSAPDAENRDVDLLAKVTYSVPANVAAGEYKLGIESLELTKDYGEIWEPNAEVNTTLTITAAPHTHSYTAKKDINYHWNECDCGEIEEGSKATHTYVGATCTKAGVCSCGAQGAKLAHKYSTSYTSDGTYHWKKCSCGAITAKAKHTSKTSVTKKAKTSANGTQVTTCSTCKKTLKTTTIYKASSVKLSTTEYEYNGKTKKPSVKVYDSKGKKLVYGTDYTYKRPSSSKKVGKYSIKVTFKGKYTGTKTLYYTINPADTKITSLKAGSKKLTVKCSKKTKYSDGYQIQYSTSSKFSSKYTKTVTIKKDTTTSATIKGLKAKKKYYVRVRCYYGSKTKYYSDWSSKKSATTKK